MKFGLQLFTDYATERGDVWRQIRAQAETAEASGFDGVFVPTDISWRRLDTLSLIAALAGVTEKVTLGSNIITLPLYPPLQVAEAVATSDLVYAGRIVLGVASGWRADEFAAAGIPFSQRVGRTYECIQLLKKLWTEPSVSFRGKYYQFERVALELKPLQRPHPPIWVGAHAAVAIERAARAGLTWIEGPRTALPTFLEKQRLYFDAATQAGHSLAELPLVREALVAETSSEATAIAKQPLLDKYAEYARQAGMVGKENASFERLAAGRFIIGSVEECRALVERYVAAGVTWLVLRMQYPQSDRHRVLASIELFGREIAAKYKTV